MAYEVLGSQTQQTGNNTVVVSNVVTSLTNYYGFIGTKYPTYVGRCVILNPSGSPATQRRVVISQTNGTGNTKILTVNRDWDTNPAETTDSLYVSYDMDDLETGGSNTGVALGTRTGTYDWTGILYIGDGTQYAGLYMGAGEGADIYDLGSSNSLIVRNNARLDVGYRNPSGSTISGGIFLFTQNTDAEPMTQYLSGSKGEVSDALLWGQIKALFLEHAAGSAITYRGSKLLSATYGSTFFGSSLYTCAISGRGGANEFIRFDANSIVDGLVLSLTAGITGTNDTSTEIITLKGVTFVNNLAYLAINSNKTFNMINPVWNATTYSDFTWTTSTANYVYDKRSVEPTIQNVTGTALQDAMVIIYEGDILDDLVVESATDSDGQVDASFTYKLHSTNSSTVTYGTHALRIDKWLYTPFVATQTSTSAVTGTYTLVEDVNIVQTTQATALSNGSGVTFTNQTNPAVVLDYTGGTGTLLVGMVITGASSTKYGTVVQILEGDSTAGTVLLDTVSATSVFTGGETISRTGGTAGTWSATYTTSTEQKFSVLINGNSKSLQTIYDYFAALTSETTLSATGELVHEWGRGSQARALFNTGASFYTKRSNSKGIFVANYDSGTVDYFTADDGSTYTPASTVDLSVTVVDTSNRPIETVQCAIYKTSDDTELMNEDTETVTTGNFVTGVKYTIVNVGDTDFTLIGASSNTVGVAFTATGPGGGTTGTATNGIATQAYTYLTDTDIYIRVRKSSSGATRYIPNSTTGTITSSGFSAKITMREETIS